MFVGYEIKSNQTSKPILLSSNIKLSQAVLDPSSKGNKKDPVCLVAEYDKKQFIIAVLDPNQSWQCPLDLMFEAGTEVKFSLRGAGTVHLTGFECYDDFDDMCMSASDDDDFEDEEITSEEDEAPKQIKDKRKSVELKSSAKKSPKVNGVKSAKSNGKLPLSGDVNENDDDNDDDDDDETFDSDDIQELTDDDDDDIDDEEEEEDDDDDDDDDDDGDDDEEMDALGELDEDDSDEE